MTQQAISTVAVAVEKTSCVAALTKNKIRISTRRMVGAESCRAQRDRSKGPGRPRNAWSSRRTLAGLEVPRRRARAARLQENVVFMGVIARRNTWSAARSRAMEVGERWRSNSKVNSIDDGKRIDVETFCDAFSRSTKLRKIVEEDENFSDVDGSSFDCGDIVRLIQLASGEPRAVKAAKMLVGFSRNQQTVIQALENQNRALRDSYGVRLDNERTRKEVRWTPRALLSSFSNKVLPPPHADVARSPFSVSLPRTAEPSRSLHPAGLIQQAECAACCCAG